MPSARPSTRADTSPTRSPVNGPGPVPAAIAVSSPRVVPAADRAWSTSGATDSPCRIGWSLVSEARTRPAASSYTATLTSGVEVSRARSTRTSLCDAAGGQRGGRSGAEPPGTHRDDPHDPGLVVLGRRYLYFLAQAQVLGGKFRNHLGYDRRWHGQPGTEDGWGYSLWALGTAAARGPTTGIREESFTRFCRGALVTSPSAHAMAFAALGAAEVLDSHPGHHGVLTLLYRASIAIGMCIVP